ncbi:MAG TPA: hypothetical protein VL053_17325 [Arachidicoccus sp.]|nr:hypothetical protein [Arachidicoccus sp.]
MKKYLVLLLLAIGNFANAQIQIGSNEIPTMNHPGNISAQDLADFKKTTTLFTFQYKDYAQQQQFEKVIKAVWTITPFKIIKPDEMDNYTNQDKYSFFSFGGFMIQHQGSSTLTSSMHLSYDLWLSDVKKNGRINQRFFSRIWLYPNNETFFTAMKSSWLRNKDFSGRMLSFLYNDALLYNWGAGFLKGYLKTVNDRLLTGNVRGPFSEETDNKALSALKRDTLYVPDYVYIHFNALTGAEIKKEEEVDEDLRKAYSFPVKIVPATTLNEMILNENNTIKYLLYVKSSTDKFINVFDGNTGSLLYARYVKISYNFKNKDLNRLEKSID